MPCASCSMLDSPGGSVLSNNKMDNLPRLKTLKCKHYIPCNLVCILYFFLELAALLRTCPDVSAGATSFYRVSFIYIQYFRYIIIVIIIVPNVLAVNK